MEERKNGRGDEVKNGLGEDPKKGVGEEAKKEGEEPKDESKVGVTRPLSDLFLTPNLPDGFFLLVFWTMSFLSPPLLPPEDLGVSAMSFRMELKIEFDSITPDAVVISAAALSVIFSLFFMKSVNIWNRSFSDILLGVVTATGSGVGRRPGTEPLVVCAGGSVVEDRKMSWGLGVVKGSAASASLLGSRVLSRLGLELGLNLRGREGRRGRNLLWNSFFLSRLSRTSLRSESSCSSSLSPCSSPDLVRETLSANRSSLSSVESSSARSGTRVDPASGLDVVDRLLVKMFLIVSFSFLVLSLGVVRGVATVVDLASPGRPRGKKRPGLRLGLNPPRAASVASVVAMPGVSPCLVVEVTRPGAPDIPAPVLVSSSPPGVVLSGGILGGDRVDTGMENSPSLTVAVSVTRGIRENSWSGDNVLDGKWMTVSSMALSASSVGILLKMSTNLGADVLDLVSSEAVVNEG